MLKAALLVAIKRGIKTLIYNGDVFATDQSSLNSWTTTWKEEKDVSYATAIYMGDNVSLNYGKWFTEQYFVSGNHDERINRKSGGEIFLELLYRNSPVKFSMYSYMFMKTPRAWAHICPPQLLQARGQQPRQRHLEHGALTGRNEMRRHPGTYPPGSTCVVAGRGEPDPRSGLHASAGALQGHSIGELPGMESQLPRHRGRVLRAHERTGHELAAGAWGSVLSTWPVSDSFALLSVRCEGPDSRSGGSLMDGMNVAVQANRRAIVSLYEIMRHMGDLNPQCRIKLLREMAQDAESLEELDDMAAVLDQRREKVRKADLYPWEFPSRRRPPGHIAQKCPAPRNNALTSLLRIWSKPARSYRASAPEPCHTTRKSAFYPQRDNTRLCVSPDSTLVSFTARQDAIRAAANDKEGAAGDPERLSFIRNRGIP